MPRNNNARNKEYVCWIAVFMVSLLLFCYYFSKTDLKCSPDWPGSQVDLEFTAIKPASNSCAEIIATIPVLVSLIVHFHFFFLLRQGFSV